MDSEQLKQKGFSRWFPFTDHNVGRAPKQPGVYLFRKAKGIQFGRLQGKSDILYIGSTEAKGGLKQRLRQYLHPGPTQWTNIRISKLSKKHEMEVAWHPCNEPGNFEHQLLQQYFKEHDELPPLNHAGKRLLKKVFSETVRETNHFSATKFSGTDA